MTLQDGKLVTDCAVETTDNLDARVSLLEGQMAGLLANPPPAPTPDAQDPGFTEQSLTCPHANDWHYVYEVEDDPNQIDLPTNDYVIGDGFSNANAYYVGNDVLNGMATIKQAQVCWGKKSDCTFVCHDLNAHNVGEAIRENRFGAVSNLESALKKLIGCFTGQCSPVAGQDTYALGAFYEAHTESERCSNKGMNNGYSGQPWGIPGSGAYTCIVGPHNSHHPVHYWASGHTMCRNGNMEIGGWSSCHHGSVDSMHIKVKLEAATEGGLHCEHNTAWEYVMEVEDDVTTDDIPDSPIAIANGYRNEHAYYVGNTELNDMNIVEAEVCFGKRTTGSGKFCNMMCMPLKQENVGSGLTNNNFPHVQSLESGLKKMIACFSGQCGPVAGQDAYSLGSFYTGKTEAERCSNRGFNNGYSGAPWGIPGESAYTCIVGPHNSHHPVHFWASGHTMCNNPNSNYEIGGWSNCNHGSVNTMQIRVKTQATENGIKCPRDAAWNYVMEIEDDATMQDMPHNANTVANGFTREHAQYIGNAALNALTFTRAQICFGKKSQCGSQTCMDIDANNVGHGITSDRWHSIRNLQGDVRKMLGCFTGQCAPVAGQDTYSLGAFFEAHTEAERCSNIGFNDGYSGQPWGIPGGGAYTCIVGPHNSNHPVHFWASGHTMCWNSGTDGNYEIGGWSNCNHGSIDSMYIRVQ